MTKSNLDTVGSNYAVKNDTFTANEDTLKVKLNSVYESARKKSLEFHWSSCYGVLFSISLTLVGSLFTSDFRALGGLSAEHVTMIAWGLFLVCLVAGIISLVVFFRGKNSGWEEDRDQTVNSILTELKQG